MSERKWPTRTGSRIRLGLIVGVLLAMVGTARADWLVQDVPNTPGDVETWPNGQYSVSASQAALLFNPDGGVARRIDNVTAAGTSLIDGPCFAAFSNENINGVVSSPTNCVPSAPLFPVGADTTTVNRVKHTEAGSGYALGYDSSGAIFAYGDAGVRQSGPWTILLQSGGAVPSDALGVLSTPGDEHALFGVRQGPLNFYWYRGPQLQATYTAPSGPFSTATPLAIDLISAEGTHPTALLATSAGLLRGPLGGPGFPFMPADVPPPVQGMQVASVDVNTEVGTSYGDGFGMALVQMPDNSTRVLRAVPGRQPEEFGKLWRVAAEQPPFSAPPREVACRGAEFCVVSLGGSNTQNVALYKNLHAPVVDAGPDPSVSEQTVGTISVSVEDPDGDPLRVTVEPRGAPPSGVSVMQNVREGGVDFALMSGILCEDQTVAFDIIAADGLASHERRVPVDLVVRHDMPPDPPALSATNVRVQAGSGEAGVIRLMPQASPRCEITQYDWEAQTLGAPEIPDDSESATFTSPLTLCEANGVSYVYRVYAKDKAGLLSPPAEFSVQVRPWGKPSAPFGPGAGVSIEAGQSHTIVPEAEHVCVGSAGYPGVDTVWELAEGAQVPSGIQLLAQDGTPVSGTQAVTPRLVVKTEECATGVLPFLVHHVPRDGSGIEGPESTYEVTVNRNLVPLDAVQLVLSELSATSESVRGRVSAPGLNCIAERGGVRANLSLLREDGSVVGTGTFNVGDPFSFPLGNSCEGAQYRLVGQLEEGAGVQGGQGGLTGALAAPVIEMPVSVPAATIPLEPLEAPRIVVSCGEPARGTLQQRLPLGPCSKVPVTWEQIDEDGPTLTQRFFTGPRIDVETQETDFGALIGQTVVLRVTANNGVVTTREHTVPITAEPFVELNRRTERPAGGETGLVGVVVELSNTTGCGVREVEQVERLEGADYVPGSARFNGAPVEATFDGTELKVSGLVLEGGTTGQLSYVVRPRLFGTQRFDGRASLRSVPITRAPEEPLSGCGCTGGGSGAAALGLVGLLAVSRRRRRAESRAAQ